MTGEELRIIEMLREADLASLRSGSVTLHFDADGLLCKLEVHRVFNARKLSTGNNSPTKAKVDIVSL